MFKQGDRIGQYVLIKLLGQGGFGAVWLAERQSQFVTNKVAVKLPHGDQIDLDAVRHEAAIWARASGHPNVLPIIEADIYDGQVAIVSEYASGGSLFDKLKSTGKFAVEDAVEMVIGILKGLDFLHRQKIIHRDIKPQNILLQEDTPRLADFGISRVMTTSSMNLTASGTEAYMAPEALDGKRNRQTDIWSVGVVLYQLLSGRLPFPQVHQAERVLAIINKKFEPLESEIPADLRKIVDKALAKSPEKRYRAVDQMQQDLEEVLAKIKHKKPDNDPPGFPWKYLIYIGAVLLVLSIIASMPFLVRKINTLTMGSRTLIPYLKGGQMGFSDEKKKIIIEPKYDAVWPFGNEGLALVAVSEKVSNPTALTSNYGFIDKTGNEIVSPKYFRAEDFKEGLAGVCSISKCGFIDSKGNEVIPLIYDRVDSFSEDLARVIKDGQFGFIDKTGNEVIPLTSKYENAGFFSGGLAAVQINFKWGYIDKKGNLVIPNVYSDASEFRDGLAYVGQTFRQGLSDRTKYGFIDTSNAVKIPLEYDTAFYFSEDSAAVSIDQKYGFIEKTGNLRIPLKYEFASIFKEGMAAVKINGKYGFIDKSGTMIIAPKYDSPGAFENGITKVELNNRWFYINAQGEEFVEN